MKTLKLFCLLFIGTIVPFITACNDEDNYNGPQFKFDSEGYCYLPSAPFISDLDFQKYVIGNPWKLKEEIPINEKGEFYKPEYESFGGSTNAIYIEEDNITIYSRLGHYLGYQTMEYEYFSEKSMLVPQDAVSSRILSVSENEFIEIRQTKYSCDYRVYIKLSENEYQQLKEVYTKNFDDVEN